MRQNPAFRIFMGFYIPLFIIGTIAAVWINKGDLVLAINTYHQPAWDVFFKYFTFLGDGALLAVIIFSLFWINKKYALLFLVVGLGQMLTAGILKTFIFGSNLRPAIHIGEHLLHFVEGVRVPWWYSFPSGHTITAFSTYLLIALLIRNKIVAILCLTIALMVAFSRIYLVLHFLEDVVAGSLIGVLLTLFFYKTAQKWHYLDDY